MKRIFAFVILALLAPGIASAQAKATRATTPAVRYGANPAAGYWSGVS